MGLLVVTLPFVATVLLAAPIGLAVADSVFAHLALVGILALALVARVTPPPGLGLARELTRTGLAAAVVLALGLALLARLGVAAHRLVPVSPRVTPTVAGALVVLPFFLAWELLLRRGPVATAFVWSAAGRVAVIAVLLLGIRTGLVASFVGLLVPVLAALFVLFEVLAVTAHRCGESVVAIAWVEAGWLGWLAGVTLPWRG